MCLWEAERVSLSVSEQDMRIMASKMHTNGGQDEGGTVVSSVAHAPQSSVTR